MAVIPDRRWTFVAVLLGTFTVSLSNTMLNPAVPMLMRRLGTDAPTAGWVLTGYLFGMAMTMPLAGWLGERFGKPRVYRASLIGFLVASMLGAFARTIEEIIAARTAQGIAAGLMIPLSLAIIFAAYPKDERGRVTGAWSMMVMLAPALGPVLGGWFMDVTDWRVLFLVNVPLGLAALPIGARTIPATRATARPFDWRGFLLCFAGIALMLGASSGVRTPAEIIGPLRVGAMLAGFAILALFVLVELRTPHPLLNLRIFAVTVYRVSVVMVVVQSIGMFGCLLLVPLMMQHTLGMSAIETGFALLAAALSMSAFGGVGGWWLDRYGARGVVIAGMVLCGLATAAFAWLPAGIGLAPVIALMALRGVGLGLCYTPVTTAGLSAVPDVHVAEGSAMANLARRLVAGIAIVLVSVQVQLRSEQLVAAGTLRRLAEAQALREGFLLIGVLILLCAPLALLFPPKARALSVDARRAVAT